MYMRRRQSSLNGLTNAKINPKKVQVVDLLTSKTSFNLLIHPLNEETKLLSSLHVGGKRGKRGGGGNREDILEANHGGSRIYNC